VTCEEIRELFSTRVDEALTPDERARFDGHLAGCADCGREWRRFEATVGLLRAAEPARAPAGFVDRVLAARPRPWYRRLARGAFSPWPVKLPLEAAALVLVAGLAVVIFQRSPDLERFPPGPEAPPPPAARSDQPPATAPGGQPRTAEDRLRDVAPAPSGPRPEDAPVGHAVPAPRAADSRAEESPRAAAPRAEPPPAVPPRPAEPESRQASRAELAAKESAPAAPGRQAERDATQPAPATAAPSPADVEARLAVSDRAAVQRDLAALVTRLGGVVTPASPEVVDIVVSRAAWDELARELARLGALRIDRRPAELPATVRLTLHLDR